MTHFFFIFLSSLFQQSCGQGFTEIRKKEVFAHPNTQFYADIRAPRGYGGWAKVQSINSQLLVKIKLFGPPSEHKFLQVLHQKQFCPSYGLFREHIMFSDLSETESIYGKVIFIFDSKLNHHLDLLEYLPKMRRRGFYFYYRAADINTLYHLGLDDFVSFKLEHQILMIYKFDPENHDFRAIACGQFKSV